MPVPTDITAGTLTITNGSTAVTGTGTSWLASDLRQGDVILWIEGGDGFQTPILADVPASNTALTLVEPWGGPTLTGVRYRIRYQWDSSRVSAQSRQLIELLDNGNILALTGLTGPGVPVFDGPHSMTVRPETDFINGVAYNVQVDTLADRDTYDGQTAGFAVLVSDVGDGRSAVYSKASSTSGDWTDPAYVTGPAGPLPTLEAGTTTRGPLATDVQPVLGGYELNLTIPTQVARGNYSGATAYLTGDIIQSAGSSWVALQSTTGNAPPSLPTTSNAYWQLLARAGNDGAGTVTTVAEGSGIDVDSTDPTIPVVSLADVPTATVKGRVDAGTGAPTNLSGTQVTSLLDVFGTTKGLAPGRPSATGLFLRDDGTWAQANDPAVAARVSDLDFTVSQLALALADANNTAYFLGPSGNRFADSFDTLTYVDVAGATNLDTSTAGVLKPTMPSGLVPASTGTPIGNMTGRGGLAAAFDGDTNQAAAAGAANEVAGDGNVGKDWGVGLTKVIVSAVLYGPNNLSIARTSGGVTTSVSAQLRGSNDNLTWTVLDTQATGTNANAVINFSSASLTPYRYHDILIPSAGGGTSNKFVAELVFTERTTPDNLTVRSTAFTALSQPSAMKALINVREVDTAVAGTDYFLDCSRDNGTTWTAMTLTERYTSGLLRVVEAAETSVTGQPSGTAPRWRFRTANNKNVELHDLYLYWN